MADGKKKNKVYTTKIADGTITISLRDEFSADGKGHSASAPYPLYMQIDGTVKRLTKAQTEAHLFELIKHAVKTE